MATTRRPTRLLSDEAPPARADGPGGDVVIRVKRSSSSGEDDDGAGWMLFAPARPPLRSEE